MRLHLGMLDPGGTFGGLGVALNGGYEVEVRKSRDLRITASPEDRETVAETLSRMERVLGTGFGYRVRVLRAIPRHVGLGSTTQLTLAVSLAVARLNSIRLPLETLAAITGRGTVSGVGTYIFRMGGFVVEGGRQGGDFPVLVARERVPGDWAFILVRPVHGRGPDENEESPMMTSIRRDEDASARICRHVLMGLLPALKRGDIETFGRHLSTVQKLVGSYFKDEQGGEFREDVANVVGLLDEVTYGAGQSSWGPTVYGLIRRADFPTVRRRLASHLADIGMEAIVEMGIPVNRGAVILEG